MSGLLFTHEERDRICYVLDFEAKGHEGMAEQLEKLGGPGVLLAKRERNLAVAKRLVVADIASREDFTI